jgi:hypothetical protein
VAGENRVVVRAKRAVRQLRRFSALSRPDAASAHVDRSIYHRRLGDHSFLPCRRTGLRRSPTGYRAVKRGRTTLRDLPFQSLPHFDSVRLRTLGKSSRRAIRDHHSVLSTFARAT